MVGKTQNPAVLISLGCYNSAINQGGLKEQTFIFHILVLEAGRFKIKVQADLSVYESPLPGFQMAAFS